jgi:hypothetical protein
MAGSYLVTISSDSEPVEPVETVASDCHIVPPRGLPQPCDYNSGWNTDGIRESAQVGVGCALGTLNGGGPWGCAAGSVAAAFGIYFGHLEDD